MTGTNIVNVVVLPLTVGITLVGVKAQVVPVGRLVRSHDRVTLLAIPLVRVARIVVEPDFPGAVVIP